ncbi:MAG: prenyltransferase [Rhodoluna sp.]|nr:prenyltransferase [Rhodoluna sp.]MBP6186553.1 prenyltransferase [Rhodoluna sp.]
MKTFKALLQSSRPVSWINTAFPFAATYVFFTGRFDLTLVIGTLFFLIPYNLLMYGINDVFDYESDLRNPRKGGIEGALLDKSLHRLTIWTSILSCVPFVIYLLAVGNAASGAMLLFAVFTVLAYSVKGLRFKERPFLDSITSASHFVNPMLFAALLVGHSLFEPVFWQSFVAFAFWGMASHAFGAVQDVKADREGGIASIATVIGARRTTRFAFALYLAAGVLMAGVSWPANLAAIAAVPYLVILLPHLNITDENCESANRGWRRFIWLNFFAGFVVTQLLFMSV